MLVIYTQYDALRVLVDFNGVAWTFSSFRHLSAVGVSSLFTRRSRHTAAAVLAVTVRIENPRRR